jgi:hypothetical protein
LISWSQLDEDRQVCCSPDDGFLGCGCDRTRPHVDGRRVMDPSNDWVIHPGMAPRVRARWPWALAIAP